MGSISKLAPDWLHKSEQLIRSQVSNLTQLLTMTQTHKFPPQGATGGKDEREPGKEAQEMVQEEFKQHPNFVEDIEQVDRHLL